MSGTHPGDAIRQSIKQTLKPLTLYAGAVLAVVLLSALAINLMQIPSLAKQQELALSQQKATHQAKALARFVEDQHTFLRFLASQTNVINALRAHDLSTL